MKRARRRKYRAGPVLRNVCTDIGSPADGGTATPFCGAGTLPGHMARASGTDPQSRLRATAPSRETSQMPQVYRPVPCFRARREDRSHTELQTVPVFHFAAAHAVSAQQCAHLCGSVSPHQSKGRLLCATQALGSVPATMDLCLGCFGQQGPLYRQQHLDLHRIIVLRRQNGGACHHRDTVGSRRWQHPYHLRVQDIDGWCCLVQWCLFAVIPRIKVRSGLQLSCHSLRPAVAYCLLQDCLVTRVAPVQTAPHPGLVPGIQAMTRTCRAKVLSRPGLPRMLDEERTLRKILRWTSCPNHHREMHSIIAFPGNSF